MHRAGNQHDMGADFQKLAAEAMKGRGPLGELSDAVARTFDAMARDRQRVLEAKIRRESVIEKGGRTTNRRRPL